MYFGKLREMSGKTGKDRKFKKRFRMPSGKRRVHSVSGRHDDDRWRNAPAFSGRHPKHFLYIISAFYRVDTKIAEVNDIGRRFLKSIEPLLP